MSFVDYTPAPDRVEGVNGVLKKSKLVILHDSEEVRYKNRPKDLNHKRKFSTWNGAKATILLTGLGFLQIYKRYLSSPILYTPLYRL